MKRPVITGVRVVLALAVGAVGGFALGQRQGLDWGLGFLKLETYGGLTQRVEAASLIRVGDVDGALAVLDAGIDAIVLSSGDVSAGPTTDLRLQALSMARLYRDIVPATGSHAREIMQTLERVPPPQGPLYCIRPGGTRAPASGLKRLRDGA